MKRVALVIPDAGPLISLGRAGRIDILLKLDLPIYLVDQVVFEVTRDRSLPDAVRIADFIAGNPAVVHVVETFVGAAAAETRRRTPAARQRGLGEAAIAEFYSRIDEVIDPADPVLILFEDSDVRRITAIIRGNVHLLSTMGLLKGMERAGLIGSAAAVWAAINAAGRFPSAAEIDRPAAAAFGGSAWLP